MTFETLNDLFLEQTQDLYDAESRLVEALPKMAEGAKTRELQQAFRNHLKETKVHVTRLEQVFEAIDEKPKKKTCHAMKGLLKEGEEALEAEGDERVRDAALIAAAQRVEHYEISSYGTLRALAEHLDMPDVAKLLQQTLDEEGEADKKLTSICEENVLAKVGRA